MSGGQLSVGYILDDPSHPLIPKNKPNLCLAFQEVQALQVDFSVTSLPQPAYAVDNGENVAVDADFVLLASAWSN